MSHFGPSVSASLSACTFCSEARGGTDNTRTPKFLPRKKNACSRRTNELITRSRPSASAVAVDDDDNNGINYGACNNSSGR